MKVYIDDIVKYIDYDEYTVKHIIYSNNGIFCNKHNKLTQMITDDNFETKKYKDYTFYIDKSIERYGEIILHIPYDHLYCEERFEKKNIGYDIFYVKHSYFDQSSYYFEFEQLNDFNLDIIISFLSSE